MRKVKALGQVESTPKGCSLDLHKEVKGKKTVKMREKNTQMKASYRLRDVLEDLPCLLLTAQLFNALSLQIALPALFEHCICSPVPREKLGRSVLWEDLKNQRKK